MRLEMKGRKLPLRFYNKNSRYGICREWILTIPRIVESSMIANLQGKMCSNRNVGENRSYLERVAFSRFSLGGHLKMSFVTRVAILRTNSFT